MSTPYITQSVENFTNYCAAVFQLNYFQALKLEIGITPPYPVFAENDNDVSDAQALRDAWDAQNLLLSNFISQAEAKRKTALLLLTTQNPTPVNPLVGNNWTALEADSSGDFNPYGDNVWTGYVPTQDPVIPQLVVLETEPEIPFAEWVAVKTVPPLPPPIPVTVPINSPILTDPGDATVDAPFTITFAPDNFYEAAIYQIKVSSAPLPTDAYIVSSGVITFDPSKSSLLHHSATKAIHISAYAFTINNVNVALGVGAPYALFVNTQPAAPATNGGVLVVQPIVEIGDKYENITDSTANVVATADDALWTIGGTVAEAAADGVATFTDLTAGHTGGLAEAQILFTSAGLISVLSDPFDIPV